MPAPLSAQTDPDTGLRFYTFNDHRLVSVTSMRRVVGVPFLLSQWQVAQVVAGAMVLRSEGLSGALTDDEYAKALRRAATLKRDEAAALGTAVHDAADKRVDPGQLASTDPMRPYLVQYQKWQQEMGPNILVSEAQVFHLGEGYAGSLDLICDISHNMTRPVKRYLVDLKTGKGTYTDHALQLALYRTAQFIGGFDPIDQCDVVFPTQTQYLEDVDAMAILHLQPEGYQFIEVPYTDELAAAALDMVNLARFFMNHPTLDTLKGDTYP